MKYFEIDIYKQFGINTAGLIRYKVKTGQPEKPQLVFEVPEVEIDKNNVFSHLGTPIMFPIKFVGGRYKYFNNGQIDEIELDDLWLPATTIATFQASKQAVETLINGGNTRIIEVWSDLLFSVRLQGIIFPTDSQTAQEQVERLYQFARVKEVNVVGDLFTILNIDTLFIKSFDVSQRRGYPNVYGFNLNCIQTKPAELIL